MSAQAVLIEAEADATIAGGSGANNNYGTSTALKCYNRSASTLDHKSYMRFDISGLTNDVETATLNLRIRTSSYIDTNVTVQVYGLNNGDAGESWGEGTITWNNAPANDTSNPNNDSHGAYGFTSSATLLGTIEIAHNLAGDTLVTLSNTALINFLNADTDGQVTLMCNGGTVWADDEVQFASRSHDTMTGPELDITVTPEPATMVLLGLGGVGLLIRRRRRA
ncbi:MAG: DNRLRE domain-containing protein [Phycisphaerae bacterium]|nr:DNRLRE domain-containing protein [Phycisphaerae bacterium]